ncbi:hypothetical protein ACIO8F_40440 [Streptomyces sp. NPDC087228]
MAAKLDYHWHLRKVMADRGLFSTTDLIPLLNVWDETECLRGVRD